MDRPNSSSQYKRVLEYAKPDSNKTRGFISSQKLWSCDCWWIANCVFKVNLLFFPCDKVKVFAEVFPDLDDSSSYLFDNNNFKVDHVSVEMFKKVIITLDFSKASDLDYIQFVVLKKWGETVIPGHYLAFQIDLGPNL